MKTYIEVLHKYFVFSGRADRREFWMFQLENLLPALVLFALSMVFVQSQSVLSNVFMALYYLYALAILLPSLGVLVRRLHDTNHSGWWYFIAFIPIVGAIILIVFLCTRSDAGDNKYGPAPANLSNSSVHGAEFKEVA